MTFRLKITLCMLSLLSVLFGLGGSLLIGASLRAALEGERESAYSAYQMVLGTLQVVSGMKGQFEYDDISHTLERLAEQNAGSWSALRLSSKEGPVYEYGSAHFTAPAEPAEPGVCVIRMEEDAQGGRFLVLSGALEAGDQTLYLDIFRDMTPLFEMRRVQERTYQAVFLFMAGICAILSYSIARVLTHPLVNLSRLSRSIATGRLSSRAAVRTRDEIGLVARDFNAMAETLEENINELKNSAERQERFMSSFAHELKTPMTSIIGYADLIRGQTLSAEEQSEAANFIVTEGKRLENLSRKLLDLLVMKHHAAAFSKVRPAALIQGLAGHLEAVYRRQDAELRCVCEDGACILEPDLTGALLVNLWDNALKSMDGRGGVIDVRSEMLPDGCRIMVRDSGRGIPPDALEHLTEAFYRADKSRAREQGGVGLGLTLVQEIVSLHHGSIRFESRVGEGTTVIVELRGGAA